MSAIGFPDGQRITQWLGAPLVQSAGLAIGNVLHTDGPFSLASWASVVVAIKPTGGSVTVTVKQQISGGPPGLELDETFVVAAGATAFEAVVLFGDAVTLTLLGSAPGVTVDYALYPSNSTTNAQVLTQATIDVQHNDALVAAEPALDFVDANGQVWTLTDDAPNSRMKVLPPRQGARSNGLVSLVNTAAFTQLKTLNFPAGAVAIDGYIRLQIIGDYLNASGASSSLHLDVELDGYFVWRDIWTVNMESAAPRRPFYLDILIANVGVANTQFAAGFVMVGDFNGVPLQGIGKANGPINDANTYGRVAAIGSANVMLADMSVAQQIRFYAAHGVASPNIELRTYAALAEVL